MEFLFFKELKQEALKHALCVPTKNLREFPRFPEDQNFQILDVVDELGIVQNFRLTIRRNRNPKPVISGHDWIQFVRERNLQYGDAVLFWKTNEANGDVTYKITPFRRFV